MTKNNSVPEVTFKSLLRAIYYSLFNLPSDSYMLAKLGDKPKQNFLIKSKNLQIGSIHYS